MQSITLILDEEGTSQIRRKDSDNIILRKAKLKMLAYKGAFDGLISQREIAEAKKGLCPKGFEVHHIIPLNCKNTESTIPNMVVIEESAHTWLHNNIYTPALMKCKPGQMCIINLPDFDRQQVLTLAKIQPFIDSYLENQRRIKASVQEMYRNKNEWYYC